MATVETVRGPVDTAELGQTLMHEHVVNVTAEVAKAYPDLSWTGDKEAVLRGVAQMLREVKARGISTVVDCTAFGHGRDVEAVQRINDMVDLNIIVCTGMYTYDYLPFFFEYGHPVRTVDGKVEDIMTEMFVRDITKGIGGTGVKAAMIKTATDKEGVTPNIERILRAVARAHRETGAPITTHTDVSIRNGLDQQRIFAEEGVDLTRVVIGHSGDSTDLDYLRALLDAGSTIGYDRFGLYLPHMGLPEMDVRIKMLAHLCDEGYSDRVVLSHDVTCHGDWIPKDWGQPLPDWVQTHISDRVVPALLEAGITQGQIDQMLVANPRHLFESPRCVLTPCLNRRSTRCWPPWEPPGRCAGSAPIRSRTTSSSRLSGPLPGRPARRTTSRGNSSWSRTRPPEPASATWWPRRPICTRRRCHRQPIRACGAPRKRPSIWYDTLVTRR